ncbi:MAG: D-Ala-D-Ala carboxypeptidase family metallohydrolase [Alcanivorax sp.]
MGDLSKHFSRYEFACKCGCGYDTVDAELLRVLEDVREQFNEPITITSGCRCKRHNVDVGGAFNSQHLYGRAADITVADTMPAAVARFAHVMVVPGIGEYNSFTHLDTRSGDHERWSG